MVNFVGAETPLGDLAVDDNQFPHLQFSTLADPGGMSLLTNVGDQLAATVSDPQG